MSYLAIADGEATGRIKFEMTEVHNFEFFTEIYADRRKPKRMLQPCGPPPPKDDD
jgi:splicing factor 3B subunit 5